MASARHLAALGGEAAERLHAVGGLLDGAGVEVAPRAVGPLGAQEEVHRLARQRQLRAQRHHAPGRWADRARRAARPARSDRPSRCGPGSPTTLRMARSRPGERRRRAQGVQQVGVGGHRGQRRVRGRRRPGSARRLRSAAGGPGRASLAGPAQHLEGQRRHRQVRRRRPGVGIAPRSGPPGAGASAPAAARIDARAELRQHQRPACDTTQAVSYSSQRCGGRPSARTARSPAESGRRAPRGGGRDQPGGRAGRAHGGDAAKPGLVAQRGHHLVEAGGLVGIAVQRPQVRGQAPGGGLDPLAEFGQRPARSRATGPAPASRPACRRRGRGGRRSGCPRYRHRIDGPAASAPLRGRPAGWGRRSATGARAARCRTRRGRPLRWPSPAVIRSSY